MSNKLYLENPYLREIDSRIVDKKYKDGKYYIKLDRTIFYPHLSGGQPGDKGNINGIAVLEVYEEANDIIHVLKENIHSDRVTLKIDWDNRLDNMQQHTGQHILSAAFYKLYNGETIGFHLGQDYVYIDITLPELSEEEVEKVEIYVNRIVLSNFDIKSYYIEKKDLDKIPVIKEPMVSSNIRIVEVDNIDFSPCSGTHLRNTGEVGIIKIRKWEKYKGNIRIEFICGNRALYDYRWKSQSIKSMGLLLSSKDKDVFNKVQLLYNQKEDLEKDNRELKKSLYKYKGDELLSNSEKIGKNPIVFKIYNDIDIKEINSISGYLNTISNPVQIYGSTFNDIGQFLVSVPEDLDINLKTIYKEISKDFEVKGGGSSNSVQGKVDIKALEELLNRFYEDIKGKI